MLRQWILGLLTGVAIATLVSVVASFLETRHYQQEILVAYTQGKEDALKLGTHKNPNWELEMKCVSMWSEKLEVANDQR
jgi:hypothetical protein